MTAVVLVVVIVVVQHHEGFIGATVSRLLLALGALVVGDAVRTRNALAEAARAQRAGEAREREVEASRRVEAERLRIARELHDTIAHALVAINVRAGVAAHLGPAQDTAAALTDIKEVSAQALSDLRSTLSLLRDQDDIAPTRPLPASMSFRSSSSGRAVPASMLWLRSIRTGCWSRRRWGRPATGSSRNR